MRSLGLLFGMLTGFVYTAAQGVDASDLMRAALQLAQAGDHPAALARMRDAAELRPTHPAYLYNLACLQSLAGEREAALATLQQLSGFGIYTPAAKDSDFASLADETAFQESTARFEANRAARGQVEAAFPLVHQSGLIEGLAWRAATDEWFFGDLHHRCVWRRATGGAPTRFTVEDAVSFGIGGLVVDEKRGLLWAAGSTQKVTSGWNEAIDGQCALLAFDLNTGALRHTYPVPNDGRVHATVDLTLATDGAVYLSDSAAPVIWRLVPGGGQLENWCEDARFRSLQGLALSTDGDTLYVADYALGLFRIAVASREIEALSARDTTLIGIDGLTRHGNALIAMQNGTNPFRVLRIEPDAQNAVANVIVLAAAQPAMVDPTLGVATDDAYFLIGQAGWDKFSAHKTQPQAHDCVVLRIGL